MWEEGGVKFLSGMEGKLGGAGRDLVGGVRAIIVNCTGVSSSFLRSLRVILLSNSLNIHAASCLVQRVQHNIARNVVDDAGRIVPFVRGAIIGVLARSKGRSVSRRPRMCLMIKIGKINGAAAVKGLSTRFHGRKGGILLTTTSAFETTTSRRLSV